MPWLNGGPSRTGVKPFLPADEYHAHRRGLGGKPARTEAVKLHDPVFPVPAVLAASLGFEGSTCDPLCPGIGQEPVLGVTPPEKHLLEEKFSEVADKRAVMEGGGGVTNVLQGSEAAEPKPGWCA